jgi:hypothetical protein
MGNEKITFFAGVGRVVFFQDRFGRDAACDHCGLDDLAF